MTQSMSFQSDDRVLLNRASEDKRFIFVLMVLSICMAVVWKSNGSSQRKKDKSQFVSGLAVGITLAQIPAIFWPFQAYRSEISHKSDSSSLASSLANSSIPRGAETLPPGIIVQLSDLHLRRLWGRPEEDLPSRAANLLTITASAKHLKAVDDIIGKFRSKEWDIMIFHDDGKVDDWYEFEWAYHVIHVAAHSQAKWWFAKRFLHPDVIDAYDFVFLWDSNVDVQFFNPEKYLEVVRSQGFAISQPGIEPKEPWSLPWLMPQRIKGSIFHRKVEEKGNKCRDPEKPPCAGFVEIQTPVFSRAAWRCVWYMLQNDLVHGWGLNFNFEKCAQGPAVQKVGVVDAQYIRLLNLPEGKASYQLGMRESDVLEDIKSRSWYERDIFFSRMEAAEKGRQLQLIDDREPKIILAR